MSYSSRLVVVQTETRADNISLLSPTVSGLQDMLKNVNVMLINIKYILMPVKVNYYVLIQVLVPKVKI